MGDTQMVTVVCRPCAVCGKQAEVSMTADQFGRWLAGEHVQNVLPSMPAPERELLISGTHPACWNKLYKGWS
jgi:hypothetical protein